MTIHQRTRQRLAAWLLLLYLGVLVYLALRNWVPAAASTRFVNLVPLRGISASLAAGPLSVLINICGNIVAFMPFGILLPLWRGTTLRWWQVALFGFGLSVSIECVQWILAYRICDIDDVLLNTCGALLGYGLVRAITINHPGTTFPPV